MSKSRITGPIGLALGDDCVGISYALGLDGPYAVIHVGDAISLHANRHTDPYMLRQLAERALETASWLDAQSAKTGELNAA
ncbi:hypothetical protein AB0451_03560 [Streptomyces sp. NPDC052000]|uniref:hypothetical protein n=1 Tax=Streptomyces sp. NPDC052000 TaxID=3155676 RepID=UPI00344C7373